MQAAPLSIQVVIDCADPHALADWWAATLRWEVEQHDEDFIRRMIAEGHATDDDTVVHDGQLRWRTGCAITSPEPGPGRPRILFQLVPEPKQHKNRVHLDLRPSHESDREGLRAELLDRGATRLGEGRQGPHAWVVLSDPEGNELCV